VLARGADEKQLARVNDQLVHMSLSDKVLLIGGWLTREQVWTHIEASNVVVLPIIIVPSDVPIAILESMARGRPVIGSSVDGIPELISGRGLVVDPLNVEEFSSAVLSLVKDKEKCKKLGENALEFMRSYPDWNDIGNQAIIETCLI
jgi:glycosyltransferase involved in cell wall biosynthesis